MKKISIIITLLLCVLAILVNTQVFASNTSTAKSTINEIARR